jgi:hypothetical protein
MESECGWHQETAAYVLGDLRGQALVDFRAHVKTCEQCQEDIELLERAADAVPLLASSPPESVDADEEEPEPFRPGVWAQERIEMVTAPKPPQLRQLMANASSSAPSGQNGLGLFAGLRGRRRGTRGGGWQIPAPKPAMAGVVALAVLAAVVLVLTKQSQSINYVHAQAAWRNGAAVLKMEGSQGQLLVVGMPAPPSGTRYELWAIKQGVRKEIPLHASLELNKKGEGGVVVPGDVRSYLALVVYAEPPDGSKTPAGTPYVVADMRKLNAKKS